MNSRKLIAIITLTCFTLTFVCGEALYAALDIRAQSPAAPSAWEDPVIPRDCGRITDSRLEGSKQLVVNIQDLHCNPEVQRNISRILSVLDKKYRLKNVYVEGGYGDISTSWICDIADKEAQKEILEGLIERGRLTGTEYYSALSHRPDLLKGIDDEALHKANIVRLGKIIERKPYYARKLKECDKDLALCEARYFSRENRRLNALVERYRAGRIAPKKYFEFLSRCVQDINDHPARYHNIFPVSMESYPSIGTYMGLARLQERLRHGKISSQIPQLVQLLRSRIPYRTFNELLKRTDNLSKTDELYACLASLAREYPLDLDTRFPDVKMFLDYTEMSGRLNPVTLLQEEKRLVEELRVAFSRDADEIKVSFLADFYGYFKDYLSNTLTADDYRYVAQRFGKFTSVWNEYVHDTVMQDLEKDFDLLNAFYALNCKRNECFVRNMGIPEPGGILAPPGAMDGNAINDQALRDSELIVVVTGGFHTEGLERLLRDRKISYVCVTPNVTQDTDASTAVYDTLAVRQADLFGNRGKTFDSQAISLALNRNVKVCSITRDSIELELDGGEKLVLSRDNHGRFRLIGRWKKIREQAGRSFSRKKLESAVNEAWRPLSRTTPGLAGENADAAGAAADAKPAPSKRARIIRYAAVCAAFVALFCIGGVLVQQLTGLDVISLYVQYRSSLPVVLSSGLISGVLTAAAELLAVILSSDEMFHHRFGQRFTVTVFSTALQGILTDLFYRSIVNFLLPGTAFADMRTFLSLTWGVLNTIIRNVAVQAVFSRLYVKDKLRDNTLSDKAAQKLRRDFSPRNQTKKALLAVEARLPAVWLQHHFSVNMVSPEFSVFFSYAIGYANYLFQTVITSKKNPKLSGRSFLAVNTGILAGFLLMSILFFPNAPGLWGACGISLSLTLVFFCLDILLARLRRPVRIAAPISVLEPADPAVANEKEVQSFIEDILTFQRAGADLIHWDCVGSSYLDTMREKGLVPRRMPNQGLVTPGLLMKLRKEHGLKLPVDVHLMDWQPKAEDIAAYQDKELMVRSIAVQFNGFGDTGQLKETLKLIKSNKRTLAGVVLELDEESALLTDDILKLADMVVLTAHVTTGLGREYTPVEDKARELRKRGYKGEIVIQGGINDRTISRAASGGATTFVSGTFPRRAGDMADAIDDLRRNARRARSLGYAMSLPENTLNGPDDQAPQVMEIQAGSSEQCRQQPPPAPDDSPVEGFNDAFILNKPKGKLKFSGKGPAFAPKFRLYVIRHGQTPLNVKKGLQGALDEPVNQLTKEGRDGAFRAAREMYDELVRKHIPLEDVVVVVSPLTRARDTAQAFIDYVYSRTGYRIVPVVDEGAKEISFGDYDNLTEEEIRNDPRFAGNDLSMIDQYRKEHNVLAAFPHGESFLDLIRRVFGFLNKLNRDYAGKTVIAFSHGTWAGAAQTLLGSDGVVDRGDRHIDWRSNMIPNSTPVLLHEPERSQDPGSDDNDDPTIPGAAGDRMTIRNAKSWAVSQTMLMYLDDVKTMPAFTRTLKAATSVGNGLMAVRPEVIDDIGRMYDDYVARGKTRITGKYAGRDDFIARKTAQIAMLARQTGNELFISLLDCAPEERESMKERYARTGITGCIYKQGNELVAYHYISGEEKLIAPIQGYDTPEALYDMIKKAPAIYTYKMLYASELRGFVTKGGMPDIDDRVSLFNMLKPQLLDLYDPGKQLSTEFVEDVAFGWDWDRLPAVEPAKFAEIVRILENGKSTIPEILAAMGLGEGKSHPVRTYVLDELAGNVKGTEKEKDLERLQRDFLRALFREVLCKDTLRGSPFTDHELRRIQGITLYRQRAQNMPFADPLITRQEFIRQNNVRSTEFFRRLNAKIIELYRDGSPEAMQTIIELIPLADREIRIQAQREEVMNKQSIDAILAAG